MKADLDKQQAILKPEALQAKQEGKEKVILFNLSGHGHVDMAAYDEAVADPATLERVRSDLDDDRALARHGWR